MTFSKEILSELIQYPQLICRVISFCVDGCNVCVLEDAEDSMMGGGVGGRGSEKERKGRVGTAKD